jgi:hypothetical protein
MKYNQATLNKIESVLDESGYIYRYERGNFQSGFCILESKKVVVLNKFLSIEGRINTLIEIIPILDINPLLLTDGSRKIYNEAVAKAAEESEAAENDAVTSLEKLAEETEA